VKHFFKRKHKLQRRDVAFGPCHRANHFGNLQGESFQQTKKRKANIKRMRPEQQLIKIDWTDLRVRISERNKVPENLKAA
jgi:hypothetical protein